MVAKCQVCGTNGFLGNAIWNCPMCDLTACNHCLEKTGQSRGGFIGIGESFTCPKCNTKLRKIAW